MSLERANGIEIEIRDYIFETLYKLDDLRRNYPSLAFSQIAPEIIALEVPPGEGEAFDNLRQEIQFVDSPSLFGLNANEALVSSNILVFHNYPYGELRGKGVIIGFVDTGIQYTNINFKEADNTTRILRLWDQTIQGNPPEGFNYGTQYTKEEIDIALKAEDPYSIVPSRDEIGHGTYLAGVAAGDDKTGIGGYTGGAPEASIIMVKMRPAKRYLREYYLISSNAPAYQENDLIAGITYLLQQAILLEKPLVICIGVGNNFGSHGGTNITERYLQTLSIVRNIAVIIAAGNEASSGHHFSGQVNNGEQQAIEINVAENEVGFTALLWTTVSNKLSISVKSPLGQTVEKIPIIPNQLHEYRFSLERSRLQVTYVYPEPFSGGEYIFIRLITPTPGIWTINVYGESVLDGKYNVWLPRNGFILENTRFLKPDPNITIQIPGTSSDTVLVGGYDYVDRSIYAPSGRGPTINDVVKPDIIAPCVNVEGPSLTGGYTTYTGTSTAAAITSSAAALLLEWAILNQNLTAINTRIVRAIFIRGATRASGTIYPNNIEGYGRLDLQRSIAMIY